MAKPKKNIFVCQQCGYQAPKWLGRCPDCGEWNTLVEEFPTPRQGRTKSGAAAAPTPITNISLDRESRLKTGLGEFDRTLGGGLVPGSLVLIGGEPGIGKSTLVLQALEQLALQGLRALYISGEESPQQIKLRAERLSAASENLFVMAETCVEEILTTLEEMKPQILAVDSIQTMYTEAMASAPGSVGQVREAASRLMGAAKTGSIPVFLVGHVTKDGAIAGPKVLEHLVDTVLYFEGDRGHLFRILR
ncbi:MAG: DNA repair protein RadA, partial [Deltaproteobacteria bacterium]